MRDELAREEGRMLYAKRAGMVEPVFGQIKEVRGARRNPSGDGQAIFTCPLVGDSCGNLHQLTGYSNICDKTNWAPDGSRILLTENCDYPDHKSANIATIKPDGTDLRVLTNYTGGHTGVISGSYSPDGLWIVYRLDQGSGTSHGLFRMRPDGTQRKLIAELPFKPRNIDWGTHP